ncbi:MAG TPA: hypothetical protein VL971_00320 [Rhizomicrobium sp.]|nr:hypothetical protein [Rhizomicrobium sp.]
MNSFFSDSRKLALAGAGAVVILAAAGGGYYFFSAKPHHATGSQSVSLAELGVCKAVVARARDYGVLPPDAAKTGDRVIDNSDPNRVTCEAEANNATFKLTADVKCDDADKDSCLILQKVTDESGAALYDTHDI